MVSKCVCVWTISWTTWSSSTWPPTKEAPTYKLITPAIISERLKACGYLAQNALRELLGKGQIRLVVAHSAQSIYSRVIKEEDEKAEKKYITYLNILIARSASSFAEKKVK